MYLLFKPIYYNEKKSYGERAAALEEENSTKKLKAASLDPELGDRLRAVAIKKLKDPEVCEMVLMEFSSGKPMDGPDKYNEERFISAAKTLKGLDEQNRLEELFDKCGSHRIQAIIVQNIENTVLLEKAALNEAEAYGPWYLGVSSNAIEALRDEEVLARIAINGMIGHAAEDSAKKVNSSELLQKIVTESKSISARVNAVRRLNDTSAVLPALRKELAPVIIEKPLDSYWEIRLLASAHDAAGRIMAYCTDAPGSLQKDYPDCIKSDEVLLAEVEIIYPFLRNIFSELTYKMDTNAWDKLPNVCKCIKLLHDNGIMIEQIEKDFPKTIDYTCNVVDYSGGDYDSRYSAERGNKIDIW